MRLPVFVAAVLILAGCDRRDGAVVSEVAGAANAEPGRDLAPTRRTPGADLLSSGG